MLAPHLVENMACPNVPFDATFDGIRWSFYLLKATKAGKLQRIKVAEVICIRMDSFLVRGICLPKKAWGNSYNSFSHALVQVGQMLKRANGKRKLNVQNW
jgi:hypothetical protein